ncbi:cyclopentanone-monooxygenase [Diplodia corticola]|uniref:Cyclopentanone-monooxygenase n=1 Tax=Diplodia corticola TaxID=236234 RepID=A0A1J9RRZ4_9PEZI|nr:cyclopentanone-monooxygenase [Diplodia corticola]OJD30660.1 cyclopentanone-monooxygenase [Diplodia corticola]
METVTELDALIVGGGFGGMWQLWRLRSEGHTVRLVESGSDFGGVWHWNRYPGARVDSPVPFYEFSRPRELWESWEGWRERFPDQPQLQAYFAHADKVLDLRRDAQFGTTVTDAVWDDETSRWTVRTQRAGEVFRVRFLLLNVGFAAKRYIPGFEGLGKFKGRWLHPSFWPEEGIDLKGKRVAVVGTGATGVQLAQELSKTAAQLTVFQRTPNLALPMGQERLHRRIDDSEKGHGSGDDDSGDMHPRLPPPKSAYPSLYASRTQSFPGFDYNFLPRLTFSDDAATRLATYERLWQHGDFRYWLANYADMLADPRANAEAYAFWRDKTRARIGDERLKEKLAPTRQPHAFGCKRIALEDGYFELFERDNVRLVDVRETPVVEVTERGIRTAGGDEGGGGEGAGAGGEEHAFDCIVFATGYDALTGGITQIDIRRRRSSSSSSSTAEPGESVKEKWDRDGARTYLGLACAGFPNMFFTYGPQAPTAFCNGPTCAELQGDWIAGVMRHVREEGLESIEARKESEEEWVRLVDEIAAKTLLPETKSWYMGDNIPGKKRQPLLYLGGVQTYYARLTECAAEGYSGFELK